MPGRTLRDAIAVALEVVPSVELAAGDELSRLALREFLLGWIKDYAFNRGVIFDDKDLETDLRIVIAELRGQVETPPPCIVEIKPGGELAVNCPDCNAKPNWRCTNIISGKYRESHARRIAAAVELARKGGGS